MILVEREVLGVVRTNVWFIVNPETKELILVDPADEALFIQKKITARGWKPRAILLTHGHYDHIGAVDELRRIYGIPCYVSEAEREVLENPSYNLSGIYGRGYTVKADYFVKDQDVLELAGFEIRVLFTPGHTKGGVCYYLPQENVLFSGDTLFCTSIGRTDLPTGSMRTLVDSVRRLVAELPGETDVYPGHEDQTQILFEQQHNPFI